MLRSAQPAPSRSFCTNRCDFKSGCTIRSHHRCYCRRPYTNLPCNALRIDQKPNWKMIRCAQAFPLVRNIRDGIAITRSDQKPVEPQSRTRGMECCAWCQCSPAVRQTESLVGPSPFIQVASQNDSPPDTLCRFNDVCDLASAVGMAQAKMQSTHRHGPERSLDAGEQSAARLQTGQIDRLDASCDKVAPQQYGVAVMTDRRCPGIGVQSSPSSSCHLIQWQRRMAGRQPFIRFLKQYDVRLHRRQHSQYAGRITPPVKAYGFTDIPAYDAKGTPAHPVRQSSSAPFPEGFSDGSVKAATRSAAIQSPSARHV